MNSNPHIPFQNKIFLFILCFWICLSIESQGATFTVINTNDAGAGSLRQAILDANATPGNDLISFAIPAGPYIISLLSSLPTITDLVTIDGDSQAGWVSTPIIELNGTGAGAGVDGITITAGSCTVKGLVIYSFSGNGISINTNGNNTITGNFIGTNAAGTIDMGNALNGILIQSSSNNAIGSTVNTDRNLISGNNAYGINITTNCDANVIKGNFIGINALGNLALGNSLSGIIIQNSCTNTSIGGTTAGDKNVISGNLNHGIYIFNNCTGTKVGAAYIGTDVSGSRDVGNSMDGIRIESSSTNDIGGNFAGPRNIISGNDQNGVNIIGASSIINNIYGNYIGLNAGGTISLPNSSNGVLMQAGATTNVVGGSIAGEGNVISGNTMHGIYFLNTTQNYIRGNYIGLNGLGTLSRPNILDGIRLETSTNIYIGGTGATDRNVISGNGANGINLMSNSNNDTINGNYIGLLAAGATTLGNTLNGIIVQSNSTNNLIGGLTTADRNIISGNLNNGIYILNTTLNSIKGNYIGLNQAGTAAIKNFQSGILIELSTAITVGGTTAVERNVVSGNGSNGVSLLTSSSITVSGNYIGMNPAGTAAINNTSSGVQMQSSSSNLIGGATVGQRNIISGNSANGINITTNSNTNSIKGNYIGLDPTGVNGTLNAANGVLIQGGSSGNIIGGSLTGEGNLISWSINHGIYVLNANGNFIRGNFIGTDITGTIAKKNFVDGIRVENSASTIIGGTTLLEQNIISGNAGNGITLINNATATSITGNYIGLIVTGTVVLPNANGILIQSSTGNTIGGSTAAERNIISGNSNGINLTTNANNNIIAGNYIGTNIAGSAAMANSTNGIFIQATSNNNVIGGLTVNERNIISGNGNGINIIGSSNGNSIQQNYIGTDVSGAALLPNTTTAITIVSSNSTLIGGSTNQRNVLVGKTNAGTILSITGTSSGTDFRGNYIGINAAGTSILGCAIGIADAGSGTIIGGTNATDRNVISGCTSFGMVVGGTGFTIQGNYIGTNATGTAAIPNAIGLSWSANNETLGGLVPGAGNLISGNGGYGVEFFGASGNFVLGNFFGTDYTGTIALGNFSGIQLSSASNTTIGGTTSAARNLISGNYNGINSNGGHDNTIIGNYIGTDINGTASLGNILNGILLSSHSYNNAIGGTAAGTSNIIAYNGDDGIEVNGSTSITNPIRQNSIFCNTAKGINLNYSTGNQGNNGYPIPVILYADINGANGTSSANAFVELFYGSCSQGKFYIATVTADASGIWSYTGSLSMPNCLVTTETSSTNNTSEFSTCVAIVDGLPIRLLNFDASLLNGVVALTWATASEKENDYFTIERSSDGIYFQEIGKVEGAENSSSLLNYLFTDYMPFQATVYYRLKQTDKNGNNSYSEIKTIYPSTSINTWNVYPNPSTGLYKVEGNSIPKTIEIINLYGVSKPIEPGQIEGNSFIITIKEESAGIYYLKITTDKGIEIIKIIKSQE